MTRPVARITRNPPRPGLVERGQSLGRYRALGQRAVEVERHRSEVGALPLDRALDQQTVRPVAATKRQRVFVGAGADGSVVEPGGPDGSQGTSRLFKLPAQIFH